MEKQCNKCNEIKDINDFYFRNDSQKYRNKCKNCLYEDSVKRIEENPDRKKEINAKWRKNNPDKIKECAASETTKKNKARWAAENPEKVKESERKYKVKRRKNDPVFKTHLIVSCSIRKALISNGSTKSGQSTFDHLPYSYIDLKNYIESLFEPWMTWENWGVYNTKTYDINPTWNLDHISPHSWFPYKDMKCQEFKDCWALENLRPFSSKQNVLDNDNRTTRQIDQIKLEIKYFLKNKYHIYLLLKDW